MITLIEMGGRMLANATKRSEIYADNIANLTTSGYKSRSQFSQTLLASELEDRKTASPVETSWTQGKLVHTENPLDLAISGDGFFAVRNGEEIRYTRDGQFKRDTEGHLVSADGSILQTSAGDLRLSAGSFTVEKDGRVQQEGRELGQLAIVNFPDKAVLQPSSGGGFSALDSAGHLLDAPQILQGSMEQSNVSGATEILGLMSTLRSAEAGQHIVQLYDDLMAQAAQGLGQIQG